MNPTTKPATLSRAPSRAGVAEVGAARSGRGIQSTRGRVRGGGAADCWSSDGEVPGMSSPGAHGPGRLVVVGGGWLVRGLHEELPGGPAMKRRTFPTLVLGSESTTLTVRGRRAGESRCAHHRRKSS